MRIMFRERSASPWQQIGSCSRERTWNVIALHQAPRSLAKPPLPRGEYKIAQEHDEKRCPKPGPKR